MSVLTLIVNYDKDRVAQVRRGNKELLLFIFFISPWSDQKIIIAEDNIGQADYWQKSSKYSHLCV